MTSGEHDKFCIMMRDGLAVPLDFDSRYSTADITPEILSLALAAHMRVTDEAAPYREVCETLPTEWQGDAASCEAAFDIEFLGSAARGVILLDSGWVTSFCDATGACSLADFIGADVYEEIAFDPGGVVPRSELYMGCRYDSI